MKKETRLVDKERGIFQATSLDERFYAVPLSNKVNGLPEYQFFPSSSWIAGYYPPSKSLMDWAKKNGIEADQILLEASIRGSKVHHALEYLISGEELKMDTKVSNGQGQEEELTTDEWEVVQSFSDWNEVTKPMYLLSEKTVISNKYRYGGTLDAVVTIDEKVYLIDFKTSKAIYPSHIIQLASYREALKEQEGLEVDGLAILQVGYKLNKRGWKFTEVDDKFPLFMNAYSFWKEENENARPRQIDLPISFKINNPIKYEALPGDKVPPRPSEFAGVEHPSRKPGSSQKTGA